MNIYIYFRPEIKGWKGRKKICLKFPAINFLIVCTLGQKPGAGGEGENCPQPADHWAGRTGQLSPRGCDQHLRQTEKTPRSME